MTPDRVSLDDCVEALAKIVAAVQHKAEHGCYPQFPGGKTFDVWAGDVAAKALRYSVSELDAFTRPQRRATRSKG